MTTRASVDERLASALRARADAVAATYQPEPFVPSTRRARQASHAWPAGSGGWAVWISGGLVAAAIIAVLLVVIVGGGRPGGRPAAPAGGQGSSSHSARRSTSPLPSDPASLSRTSTRPPAAHSTGYRAGPMTTPKTSGGRGTSAHSARHAKSRVPSDAADSGGPPPWPLTGDSTGYRTGYQGESTSAPQTSSGSPEDTGIPTTSNPTN